MAIAKPSKRGVKDWPDKKKELRSSHDQLVPYGSKLILGVKLKPTNMYCERLIQVRLLLVKYNALDYANINVLNSRCRINGQMRLAFKPRMDDM